LIRKDLRQYADEVDLENDDLRQRLAVWATRYEEMKRRHELALQREQESCRTRVASADADMASMALQLQQALVNCESQELTMSNLRMQMVRRAPEDLAEVERSVAAENDKLRQTIAGLKQRPEGRAGPELKEQLVALQRETDALRAALAAYEAAPSVAAVVAAAPAVPSSGLLREKDAQLEAMNQEMDRKEQEMAEREQKIEELEDQVNFLKSQIHTINFLKASVIPGVQQRVVMAAPVAPARKAAKTVAPSEEAVAATKARAKEQVAARLRKKEEERARKAAAEDEAQVVADMRREQERQEKVRDAQLLLHF
jgi:DNA repair exonuclease SbcCD ATPase subunit